VFNFHFGQYYDQLTKALAVETKAKTEAAYMYLETEAKAQGSWPILINSAIFP